MLQQRSTESTAKVAVLTDSAADLPAAVAERHGIHIVPVRVSLDGRDYLDRLGLTAGEFYRRMAHSEKLPQTSQPPAGDFRRVFEHVLAYQPGAVYVGLSRPLSGTLQAGETAARGFAKPAKVFDSGHACAGEGLLAWRAGEMADADPVKMYLNDVFTVTVNLAGLPGVSVPVGLDAQGLPLGLQLIGRPWEEDALLNYAHVLESRAGFVAKAEKWW